MRREKQFELTVETVYVVVNLAGRCIGWSKYGCFGIVCQRVDGNFRAFTVHKPAEECSYEELREVYDPVYGRRYNA